MFVWQAHSVSVSIFEVNTINLTYQLIIHLTRPTIVQVEEKSWGHKSDTDL